MAYLNGGQGGPGQQCGDGYSFSNPAAPGGDGNSMTQGVEIFVKLKQIMSRINIDYQLSVVLWGRRDHAVEMLIKRRPRRRRRC